jgi:hypothetical protein
MLIVAFISLFRLASRAGKGKTVSRVLRFATHPLDHLTGTRDCDLKTLAHLVYSRGDRA